METWKKGKLLPYYRNFEFCEITHKHRKDWRDKISVMTGYL